MCPETWYASHGPKIAHHMQETNEQFSIKPTSNRYFEKRRVHDANYELEIDIIPSLPFRTEADEFGEDKAYEVFIRTFLQKQNK